MGVTASAADSQAEERAAGGGDHVVQFVGPLLGGEDRIGAFHAVPRAADEESWKPLLLQGNARQVVTTIAPNAKARDFKFIVMGQD